MEAPPAPPSSEQIAAAARIFVALATRNACSMPPPSGVTVSLPGARYFNVPTITLWLPALATPPPAGADLPPVPPPVPDCALPELSEEEPPVGWAEAEESAAP